MWTSMNHIPNVLGFDGQLTAVEHFFKLIVLPFGLQLVIYLLNLQGLLKKKWRSEGKQVIMYLNDGLGIEQDDELCKVVVNQVKYDLINCGFVPKVEKSLWKPTKPRLIWLGTFIDSEAGFYKIPDQRIDKILSTVNDIRTCLVTRKTVYVRKVASFVGQIISTYSGHSIADGQRANCPFNSIFSLATLFSKMKMSK